MNGTMVIITSPDGQVQAAEVSFEHASGAGVDDEIVQAAQARDKAMAELVRSHCSGAMAEAILGIGSGYMLARLRQQLQEAGWKFSERQVEALP